MCSCFNSCDHAGPFQFITFHHQHPGLRDGAQPPEHQDFSAGGGDRQRNGGVHSGCKSIIPVMEDYQLLSARGQIINIFDCLNPASAVRRIMSSMQRNRCNYPPTKMIKFGPWDIICVIPSPSPTLIGITHFCSAR